jgi:hypothetical protein
VSPLQIGPLTGEQIEPPALPIILQADHASPAPEPPLHLLQVALHTQLPLGWNATGDRSQQTRTIPIFFHLFKTRLPPADNRPRRRLV